MQKEFDHWNGQKKAINEADERLYFREGEVWWVHLGANIGFEIDGKQADFSRPVLILKKYNKYSFLAMPLTTNARPSPYRLFVGMIDGKASYGVLSQLRNLDSLRLINKVCTIDTALIPHIRKAASKANLD